MNPNAYGDGLPVVIRIYQLKEKAKAEGADFKTLWKSDEVILQGDLMERQEVTLAPEGRQDVTINLQKEAKYLMVMALFLQHEGTHWREIVTLEGGWGGKSVEIIIDEKGIRIKKQTQEKQDERYTQGGLERGNVSLAAPFSTSGGLL